AGAGPELDYLKKLSLDLNLTPQVEFLGFKSGSVLDDLISQAKAIVIPSIWPENMPFSLLESMARGKVVLASKVGGLGELIKDKINGFIFLPNSPRDLKSSLDLLNQANLLAIGQKARETVAPLELQKHLNKLTGIYRELI
ncbi:MAG: glycosyltransferase, partial [Candidatus Falkowbacteria bacterium]|nr:glycosyltransferase [Candidatus Falkowbacteria bacterium]